MSNSALLKSSLAKKYWMAITGLFLCLFLVGHLAGNLQLLMPFGKEAAEQFNAYARFMTTNPLVKILSYVTYISILFHAIDGFMLAIQNKKARPVSYQKSSPGANSSAASRLMAVLGTLILVFIVTHMVNFWAKMHFSELPMMNVDGEPMKNLYMLVIAFFKHPDYGIIATIGYVVAMAVLAFHLSHGFHSAFQSLGIHHRKYTPLIKKVGLGFSVVIPMLFALIPVYIHFGMSGNEVETMVKLFLEIQ